MSSGLDGRNVAITTSIEDMQYWVFKSEPECYSIADLEREGRTQWDGVRNYQVRNLMRDVMCVGDQALFYHSNAGTETGVAGELTIESAAYPDPTQFDPQSEHPDPRSDPDDPRWLCVDVSFRARWHRIVTLAELKGDPALADTPLLARGNRLSIFPLREAQVTRIRSYLE